LLCVPTPVLSLLSYSPSSRSMSVRLSTPPLSQRQPRSLWMATAWLLRSRGRVVLCADLCLSFYFGCCLFLFSCV
jgi:hypothetical protein